MRNMGSTKGLIALSMAFVACRPALGPDASRRPPTPRRAPLQMGTGDWMISDVVGSDQPAGLPGFRDCYTSHLDGGRYAQGVLEIEVEVDDRGQASNPMVTRAVEPPELGTCIAETMERTTFPPSAAGTTRLITRSFRLGDETCPTCAHPGYAIRADARYGLLAAGAVVHGLTYAAASIPALVNSVQPPDDRPWGRLAIPFAGPFLQADTYPDQPGPTLGFVALGLAQLVGGTLLIMGGAWPDVSTETIGVTVDPQRGAVVRF